MALTGGLFLITQQTSLKTATNDKPQLKVNYPNLSSHLGNSFACEGLLNSEVYASNGALGHEKGIFTKSSSKNVDKITIEIDGNDLRFTFTSQTDIRVGTARAKPLPITENSQNRLIAVDTQSPRSLGSNGNPVDVFAMDKQSGLAAWTRTEPDFIGTTGPYTITEYLVCR